MALTESKQIVFIFPNPLHDAFPWPIPPALSQDFATMAREYRTGIYTYLETSFLPNSPLTDRAFVVFDRYAPRLYQEKRWKNYQVTEMGDMNDGTHILRQAGITASALYLDSETLNIRNSQKDAMIAAALMHDLGELTTGDITHEIKEKGDRAAYDRAEARAVMEMIDGVDFGEEDGIARRLKEIYLRITTSLSEGDIAGLLGDKESVFEEEMNWSKLKKMFKLYERYGFLITAHQQWPFPIDGVIRNLTKEEEAKLINWNRVELEAALAKGDAVSDRVRAAVLMKNVLLNQWPHIEKAADVEGTPSARIFFDHPYLQSMILTADRLMQLNLPNLHTYYNADGIEFMARVGETIFPVCKRYFYQTVEDYYADGSLDPDYEYYAFIRGECITGKDYLEICEKAKLLL